MASEITAVGQLRATKGSINVAIPATQVSKAIDWTGTRYSSGVQNIGVTHEAVDIGADVATPGMAFFRNLSDTNTITLGLEVSAAFCEMLELKPGEFAVVRLATADIYAITTSGGADLEYAVLED
jgi:hypothetical protein